MLWGLIATLHLPWIDAAKSYLPVFAELRRTLPAGVDCLASSGQMTLRLRESERGLLH